MEKIYIIESIYHGKTEDMYDSYPHKTLEGAKKHLAKLVEEFKEENKDETLSFEEIESVYANIDFGDFSPNELILNIIEYEIGE